MAAENVGAIPVCNTNGRLCGVDGSEVVTIGADSVEQAIRPMKGPAVRRLPVIDGTSLVGMVSQADIAQRCRTRPSATSSTQFRAPHRTADPACDAGGVAVGH